MEVMMSIMVHIVMSRDMSIVVHVVVSIMVHSLMMSNVMVRVISMMLLSQLLVVFVMRRQVMRIVIEMMTIVIFHLQNERAILDIGLATHEERRVVIKSPVVARVPLRLIEGVEVISPAKREVLLIHIIIIHFNEIILGIPRHVRVIEVVVPRRPGWGPEVHHKLSGHGKEVHILGALALTYKLVLNEPADLLRSPFNGVSDPVSAGVEASGVVMILSAVSPNNVHGEGILVNGRHELNIDFVPAMGPVLSSVSEEGLNGTHLSRILHFHNEFTVMEPLLRTNFTGEVIGLSDTSDNGSNELLHLCLC